METMKYKIVYNLIMNLGVSFALSMAAQLLSVGKVIPSLFFVNLLLAYVIALVIGIFIPVGRIGFGFAKLFKEKPGTLKFALLFNVPVSLIFTVILSLCMTYFNVIILQKLPMVVFAKGFLSLILPLYAVGYIVSLVLDQPAHKVVKKILK